MEGRALVPFNVSDPLRSGAQGISRGLARANAAAVAKSSAADPATLTRSAVGTLEARLQVEASANVVRAGDRLLGNLLDVFA